MAASGVPGPAFLDIADSRIFTLESLQSPLLSHRNPTNRIQVIEATGPIIVG